MSRLRIQPKDSFHQWNQLKVPNILTQATYYEIAAGVSYCLKDRALPRQILTVVVISSCLPYQLACVRQNAANLVEVVQINEICFNN